MAGTFTPKVIAEGQVANTKTTVYTVPVSTQAYLGKLTLFNTNAASQTVILYLKPGSVSRKIRQIVLAQNESYEVDFRGLTLEAGDGIEAETTTASAVDYVLTAMEET